jgi:hypothetical protein
VIEGEGSTIAASEGAALGTKLAAVNAADVFNNVRRLSGIIALIFITRSYNIFE